MFPSLLSLIDRVMAPVGGTSPLQRIFVKAVIGDSLTKEELALWRKATGRVGLIAWFRAYRQKPANEIWLLCGRRAFKTTFGACLVIWEATRRVVPEGQAWTIPVVAPGLRQGNRIALDMVRRIVTSIPELAPMLVGDTTDSLTFSTGVTVITLPPRVSLIAASAICRISTPRAAVVVGPLETKNLPRRSAVPQRLQAFGRRRRVRRALAGSLRDLVSAA